MTSREEVVSNFTGVLRQYQPLRHYYPGFLGETDAVDAPVNTNRENYIWVRYPYSNSQAIPVLCLIGIPRVAGYKVTVGKLPWMDQDQVLWANDFRLDGVSPTDAVVAAGSTGGYTAYPSAANFMYLSTDPIYVNWRQITPLGVFPTDNASMIVQVRGGYIARPGGAVYVADQTIDLTSHIPVSGARYVLVSYDATGNVVLTDGAINAGGFSALTAADIPATPAGNWRSAAVVLYAGQTAVVETRSEIDFSDLRFPEEKTALNQPLTNTHILVGNASNVAADVAMSNDATIANTGAVTLKNTGPGAMGPIGNATTVPVITIDAQGRTTALSSIAIAFPFGAINVYNETIVANGVSTTYYLANYAAPGTIRVYINGIRQPASDDATATDTVVFSTLPTGGALLLFDYEMEIV
jgi:hypothetical protein